MDKVRYLETTLTLESAREKYLYMLKQKHDLEAGVITPRAVIGAGYIRPRESAAEYVNQQLATYRTLVRVMEEN
jgi:hypothetical protein